MDYGHDLQRLVIKAYPGMPSSAQEIRLLERFTDGLDDPEVSEYVDLGQPKTLEAAVALAMHYESVRRKRRKDKPKKPTAGHVAAVSGQQPDNKSQVPASDMAKWMDMTTKVMAEVNNIKKQLENMQKSSNQSQRGGRNGDKRSKADIVCFQCQKKGHYARECPERGRSQGDQASQRQQNSWRENDKNLN